MWREEWTTGAREWRAVGSRWQVPHQVRKHATVVCGGEPIDEKADDDELVVGAVCD